MKNPSIQVNTVEYNKDKKFSLMITSPALELTNIQDGNIGFHLQVLHGGTHPNGVGSELTIFFLLSFSLQLVSFYSRWRTTVTDGRGRQIHLTRDFFSTLSSLCTHHIVAQGVARRVCIKHVHPDVITCLSVCCFFVLSSSSVSRASTFSLTSTCSLS